MSEYDAFNQSAKQLTLVPVFAMTTDLSTLYLDRDVSNVGLGTVVSPKQGKY